MWNRAATLATVCAALLLILLVTGPRKRVPAWRAAWDTIPYNVSTCPPMAPRFHGQLESGADGVVEPLDALVYHRLFVHRCGGVVVDIGANNGVDLSNSFMFERDLYWRSICVEPNPIMFADLSRTRPRCDNINAGIGTSDQTMDFLQVVGPVNMLSGWVNGITPGHLARIDSEIARYGGHKTVIPVPARSLESILRERGITTVDLVSLDVEGFELEILKSINFDRVDVRNFVIEENTSEARASITAFMAEKGYRRIVSFGFNGLFSRDP